MKHHEPLDQVVGYSGMAEMLGVGRRAPAVWRQRNQLPEPDFEAINGGPAWWRSTVIRWAVKTNRARRLVHEADQALAAELAER